MCSLIRQALDQNVKRRPDDVLFRVVAPRPVVLHGIRALQDADSTDGEAAEALMLIGIEAHVPIAYGDDGFDIVRLSLSAENGMNLLSKAMVLGTTKTVSVDSVPQVAKLGRGKMLLVPHCIMTQALSMLLTSYVVGTPAVFRITRLVMMQVHSSAPRATALCHSFPTES